jgi:hypothetical protein
VLLAKGPEDPLWNLRDKLMRIRPYVGEKRW